MKLKPLFLSAARRSVSNEQSRARPAHNSDVGAFDNSIPSAASRTKHHSHDNGCQTYPRSNALCGPTSNNLRHSRWHTLHVLMHWSIAAGQQPINDWDALRHEAAIWTCVWMTEIPAAIGSQFAVSRPPALQPRLALDPVAADPRRAPGDPLIVRMFQMVSCRYYCTRSPQWTINY